VFLFYFDMSSPDIKAIVESFKRVTASGSTVDAEFVVPYSPKEADTNSSSSF